MRRSTRSSTRSKACKLQKLNVHNILKAVRDKYPEVTKEFEAFL